MGSGIEKNGVYMYLEQDCSGLNQSQLRTLLIKVPTNPSCYVWYIRAWKILRHAEWVPGLRLGTIAIEEHWLPVKVLYSLQLLLLLNNS